MKIWIVGLPNVGKSTLFNALTDSYSAPAENFPFCTIEPNIWIVDVKDPRIDKLAEMSNTKKTVYANIKFVDIAWLVKWASKGEWMWNKFLSHIREVDAIAQVVRYFEDNDIWHVHGRIDPIQDSEIINTELIISDLEQVDKRLSSIQAKVKWRDPASVKEQSALEIIKKNLESEKLAIECQDELNDEQKSLIKPLNLLTNKPFVYIVNVWTDDLPKYEQIQKKFSEIFKKPVCVVSAKLESEMIWLSKEDKEQFLEDYMWWANINPDTKPTLDTVIQTAFKSVGLSYYFTTWEKETRAWTISIWFKAPQAAGVIHTDFERWFIKAEVVGYEDLINAWSRAKARENGKLRLEGKEYVVKDWDVMIFKFNV